MDRVWATSASTSWEASQRHMRVRSGPTNRSNNHSGMGIRRGLLFAGLAPEGEAVRASPDSLPTFGFELDLGLDLVFEVALRAASEHQAFSGVGPGSITRAMDSTRRFQRPVSTVNCLRPAAVIE